MSVRHADDQELCRQLAGVFRGWLCDACEGRCPICDSRSNPARPVHVCDACAGSQRFELRESAAGEAGAAPPNPAASGSASGGGTFGDNSATSVGAIRSVMLARDAPRCIICHGLPARHAAMYCRACVLLEKDRDGCPRTKVTTGPRKAATAAQLARRRERTATTATATAAASAGGIGDL